MGDTGNPMLGKPIRQICIGLSTEAEVEPGETATATATIDRPGLVESLIFQSLLVPMDRFSFKVEWVMPGKSSEKREVISGLVLDGVVRFADYPGCASVLVRQWDVLHLTMMNPTAERRVLRASAWMSELPEGPSCLDVATGPWAGGKKPWEYGDD